jgi:VanZ family protein
MRRWIPPVMWGILLAVLSLMPGGQGEFLLFGIPHIDKIAHLFMYTVWTFLVYQAWTGNSHLSAKKIMFLTFLLGTLTGILLEYGQYFMTLGRSFEVADMIANGIGSLLGPLVGFVWLASRKGR